MLENTKETKVVPLPDLSGNLQKLLLEMPKLEADILKWSQKFRDAILGAVGEIPNFSPGIKMISGSNSHL